MTVLVCGGRDYSDWEHVYAVLDEMKPSCVVHGDARGADHLASRWASLRGVEQRAYPAQWYQHGRSAGPRRNARMLRYEKPDLVVAFAGGRGTADMVRRAREAGIAIREEARNER